MRHVELSGSDLGQPEFPAPPVGARPEIVDVVRRQLRAGTYRPHSDEVAELLIAWLFLPTGTRAA